MYLCEVFNFFFTWNFLDQFQGKLSESHNYFITFYFIGEKLLDRPWELCVMCQKFVSCQLVCWALYLYHKAMFKGFFFLRLWPKQFCELKFTSMTHLWTHLCWGFFFVPQIHCDYEFIKFGVLWLFNVLRSRLQALCWLIVLS